MIGTIGERIKVLRRNRRLTQIELAKRVNISQCYLAMIENGSRNANTQILGDISKEVGTSVDYLLYGEKGAVNPL